MHLVFLNASPKAGTGVSGVLLNRFCRINPGLSPAAALHFAGQPVSAFDRELLAPCDTLLVASPLYLDALPGHFLSVLEQLQGVLPQKARVYSLINCGFYEGNQTVGGHRVLENWCRENNLAYQGGLGIGGGGSICLLEKLPDFCWPRRRIDRAILSLGKAVSRGAPFPVCYTTVDYPRFFYLKGSQISWNQKGRAAGLHKKDLQRPLPR